MNLSLPQKRALTLFFLLCVGGLAILKISNADAWIHLSLGKLIWDLKGLPSHEMFIPSMADKPFCYSSWLFGIIYYGSYHFFGANGVILLKAFSVAAIFAVLLKDSLSPHKNGAVAVAVLIVVAVCMRARFVERPDTFLMLFLSYSIMALNLYLLEGNRRHLYALPLVHLLWANSHSSINLLFVPFIAVAGSAVIAQLFRGNSAIGGRALTRQEVRVIATVFAASVAGALLSPYGITQFTAAVQFLDTEALKQGINELRPTAWGFGFRWFYVLLGVTVLSFLAAWRRVLLADLLRILPFIYLGFLSRRFVYVFAVVAAPILVRNISATVAALSERNRLPVFPRTALLVAVYCWVAAWTATAFAQVGPFKNYLETAGFGFNLGYVPEKALAYMDSRNITGRLFNEFGWGQYIEWRDYPRRLPFIDGRGYIPKQYITPFFSGNGWDEIAREQNIDAFLVGYPVNEKDATPETDLALGIPGWVLVYWDDNSLVYLKKGGRYDAVIEKDRYSFVKPANGGKVAAIEAADPAKRAGLVAELERNVKETGSARGNYLLGVVYMQGGEYQKAAARFSSVPNPSHEVLNDIGRCYERLGDDKAALQKYRSSLEVKENATAHLRLGSLLLNEGDAAGAVKELKRAVALDKSKAEAYQQLATAYRKLGQEAEALQTEQDLRRNAPHGEAKQYFNAGVKAYMGGDFVGASAAFEKSIAADPAPAMPYANLGFAQLQMGQPDKAFACFEQALQRSGDCSIAHYGIAMVYEMRGDATTAKTHLKRYLELEPGGPFAAQVKRELEKI